MANLTGTLDWSGGSPRDPIANLHHAIERDAWGPVVVPMSTDTFRALCEWQRRQNERKWLERLCAGEAYRVRLTATALLARRVYSTADGALNRARELEVAS